MNQLRAVLRIACRVSGLVAGALILYVAIATVCGVVLRYAFHDPSRFLFESTELAIALAVFFALPLTALHDGHVRMDVLPVRLAVVGRGADAVAGLFLLGFSLVLFLQFLEDLGTGTPIGSAAGFPRWIAMLCMSAGTAVFGAWLFVSAWPNKGSADGPGDLEAQA